MTPLSKRRVREAWVLVMLVMAISFATLVLGFVLGLTARKDYTCPEVPGAKVITTSDTKSGQYCVYVNNEGYGKAKVRVKL